MVQGTFDELGTPLPDVTFVVVDLETTGGVRPTSAITEIGAVKVRGGEVLGEFQTLVDPGEPIPPFIAVLTGITDTMVARRPASAVLPAFLEFARGAVLVAHNAPFDIGFLKPRRVARADWPALAVVDTVAWPAGCHPGRGAQLQALHAGCAVRRDHTPDHRALRTRGRPSTCCTGCSNASAARRPFARGADHVHLPGQPGAAPQAPPGRRLPSAGRLPVQGRPRPGLYVGTSATPDPGSQLLHRVRAAHPDGRDGAARRASRRSSAPPHWRRRCASSG